MKTLGHLTFLLIVSLLAGSALQAQSVTYGGIGDPATAPGDPASSYALSGLDHVNFYSGLVNLTLPLHSLGGRGSVAHNMMFPVQREWEVYSSGGSAYPGTNISPHLGGGYTSGYLQLYTVSGNASECQTNNTDGTTSISLLGPILTYIAWVKTDGTQVILTDLNSDGQPQPGPSTCGQSYTPYNRGRYFRSTDGSDALFVADADVIDDTGSGIVTGTLRTRDGMQYIFSGANNDPYATSVKDRNGNQISFGPFSPTNTGGVYSMTDPVGRTTSVNVTEAPHDGSQDVISYMGYPSQPLSITVAYSSLENALAPNETIQAYSCLFPELPGSSSSQFNPYVASKITLADGSYYQMQYNAYGEPSRLTLPTGAYYVYTYPEAQNCTANTGSGVFKLSDGTYGIHRAVQERDEYANGGTILTGKTLFSWVTGGNSDPNFPSRPTTVATVTYEDGTGKILRIEKHSFWGNPAPTTATASNPTQFANWWLGLEYQTDVIDSSLVTEQSVTRAYRQQACPVAGESSSCPNGTNLTVDTAPAHDPLLCQVNTSLSSNATSSTFYLYDSFNNPTDEYDFDFGASAALTGACPATIPAGALRHTQTAYVFGTPLGNYTSPQPNLLSLPSEVKVMDGSGTLYSDTMYKYDELGISNAPDIIGHDNTNYANDGIMRGNVTTVSRFLNTTGSWLKSTLQYDIAGNLVASNQPPLSGQTTGYGTTFVYTDSYSDGTSRNSYANPSSATNALGETQYWVYDYNSGKPVTYTNTNGNKTTYQYSDSFNRLTQVINPDTSQINYTYPSSVQVNAYQDQVIAGDKALTTITTYDGLGRGVNVQTTDDSGSGFITTTTGYDALGRVSTTTNPMRSGDTPIYTTYAYDALGRLTAIQTADGNSATNSYNGNQVIQADQMANTRSYTYDSLGRLGSVVEDPSNLSAQYTGNNFQTNYSYDPLGNLTCVNQGGNCANVSQGGRYRTFSYDTLSRLTSATNPESGTITYTYNDSGTLYQKTDARPVTTTNTYDQLNRLVTTTYNDNITPGVRYTYGSANNGIANSIDQITKVDNTTSASNYTSFDVMGRVTASSQVTNGYTYTFPNYTYNLAGSLTNETYPSGRVVTTNYNAANRPLGVSGKVNGASTPYVSNMIYWPHGALHSYQRGNHLWSFAIYNSRLQPVQTYESLYNDPNQDLSLSCLDWGTQSPDGCPGSFSASADNGTLKHKVDYVGGPAALGSLTSFSHTYTYDNLNRLSKDTDSGGATRTMSYDQWGNMAMGGAFLSGVTPTATSGFNAKNQLISSLFQYDNAGNMTLLGSIGIGYDANNRQISTSDTTLHVQAGYLYDGLGQRVARSLANGPTTLYVYDALGQLAAEYSTASSTPPCTTCYLSYDHLGSVRMVTDGSGSVIARHDYVPFGEEIPTGTTYGRLSPFGNDDGLRQKFTGQERDSENTPALDYFNARYMSSVLGRFASPDPGNAGAVLTNPQSWNGYSYALNNPLALVDPSGLCSLGADGYYHDDPGEPCVAAGQNTTTVDGGSPDPIEIAPIEIPNPGITPGNNPTVTSVPNQAGDPAKSGTQYPQLSKDQCKAINTILLRESLFGTPRAARMSSNTGGDGTLGPLNSSYVPNPKTPLGELDVDWYTDLVGHGYGYGVAIYPFAKLFWSVTRTYYNLPVGHALPYTDPGERTAQILLLGGGYSDAFPPDYMKQACPNGG